MSPQHCFKCGRRVQWTPTLIRICVEYHAALTDEEREGLEQEMWERTSSKEFLKKWPTPAAFNAGPRSWQVEVAG